MRQARACSPRRGSRYGHRDAHRDNFEGTWGKAVILDQAMIVPLSGLYAKELLDQTLVVLGAEFGRTPRINGNDGRDHHNRTFERSRACWPGLGSRMWGDVRVGWRVHRLRRGHAQREFGRGSPSTRSPGSSWTTRFDNRRPMFIIVFSSWQIFSDTSWSIHE